MSSPRRSPIVSAFLNSDYATLRKMVKTMDKKLLPYCRALALFSEMQNSVNGYKLYQDAEIEVRAALEQPPSDTELFISLLCSAVFFAQYSDRPEDAERFRLHLEQFRRSKLSSDIQLLMLETEWHFYYLNRNFPKQFELADAALELADKPGSKEWLSFKINRIESALFQHDTSAAERDLADIKPFRNIVLSPRKLCYEYLQSWSYLFSGETRLYQEALDLLDSCPPEKVVGFEGRFLKSRIQLLLRLNKFDVVEKLLNEAEKTAQEVSSVTFAFPRFLTRLNYENLRAHQAFAKRDFEKARTHAQQALNLVRIDRFLFTYESRSHLLNAELSLGKARQARLILQIMDPEEKSMLVGWGRLHLLEGDREKASQCFKTVLANNPPERVRELFRLAFEVSPGDLAAIAMDSSSAPKKESSPRVPPKTESSFGSAAVNSFVGDSLAAQNIRQQIEKFASLDTAVLITGETGSGKEVVARLLHQQGSHASEPFIAVNCGAMTDNLIESELFGHVKGAFTGASSDREGLFLAAGKGTIFLDEITSMSSQLQSSLLRVLEDRQIRPVGSSKSLNVKARVIAATNEPLDEAVAQKKFRMDLYFRLARLHIVIPPLRERVEDMPVLVKHILKKLYLDLKVSVGSDLIEALKRYNWPGNVRELYNEIERIALMAGDSPILTSSAFELDRRHRPTFSAPSPVTPAFSPVPSTPAISAKVRDGHTYRVHRLQQIRELFNHYDKVTRAQVIDHLQCSANTATRDLKTLEKENWIRRVCTSKHMNTSYFVRC
jgi:DNA-binding NtrC family response regulator